MRSSLRSELTRFALIHGMQVAQLAACNRLHEVEQRLVRWLLMARTASILHYFP